MSEDSKPKSTLRLGGDEKEAVNIPKQSAPRNSLKLSDWDNFKRQDDTAERDRYFVPPELIPEGFSVEWKRTEVLGKPDRRNLVQIETAGWRPAPADMFREMLPSGYTGDTVEDGEGMMLYIRPMHFTKAAMDDQYKTATKKVKDYENATLNDLSTAHKSVPKTVSAFSRSYEKSIPVPD